MAGHADEHAVARRAAARPTRPAPPAPAARPCRAPPPARARARPARSSAERAHAALGLRHDLVGDHEHVAVREVRRRGRRDAARRGRRRGATSGSASSARAESAAVRPAPAAAARPASGRAGAARRAWTGAWPRRRLERGGQQLAGRRRCPRRAPAWAPRSTAHATPPRAPRPRGARSCPGRSSARSRRAGASSSAFVPVAVAVRARSPRRAARRARAAAAPPPRPGRAAACRRARAARGSKPRRERVADPDQRGRRLARLLGVLAAPRTRSPSAAASAHAVGGHDRHRVEPGHLRRSEASTSENIAWASAWREPAAERGSEPLLRGAEALHGEDRERAHRGRRARARVARSARAAAVRRPGYAQTPGSFVPPAACARVSISVSITRAAGRRRPRRPRSRRAASP